MIFKRFISSSEINKKLTWMVLALLATIGGFITSVAQATDPIYTWGIGSYFSSGDYLRDEATDIMMLPISIKRQQGFSWFKIASSIVQIQGPGTINPEIDNNRYTNREASLNKSPGLGDTFFSAGKLFWHTPYWFELSAKYKFATADEDKGLGTGEDDFKISGKGFYPINRFTPYVELSQQWRNSPDGIALLNRQSLSIGTAIKKDQNQTWLLQLDWQSNSVENLPNREEIFIAHTLKAKHNKSVTFFGHTGFTKVSPDIGIGIHFSKRH